MMEAGGLAVGVLSLYDVSMKVLDRVHDFQHFETDAQTTFTRFDASKLKLQNWAKALGIRGGKLADRYDSRLDDPQTVIVVQNILRWSIKAFDKVEDTRGSFNLPLRTGSAGPDGWVLPVDDVRIVEPRQKLSTRDRFPWATGGKTKLDKVVNDFERLVSTLSDIVPPTKPEAGSIIQCIFLAR